MLCAAVDMLNLFIWSTNLLIKVVCMCLIWMWSLNHHSEVPWIYEQRPHRPRCLSDPHPSVVIELFWLLHKCFFVCFFTFVLLLCICLVALQLPFPDDRLHAYRAVGGPDLRCTKNYSSRCDAKVLLVFVLLLYRVLCLRWSYAVLICDVWKADTAKKFNGFCFHSKRLLYIYSEYYPRSCRSDAGELIFFDLLTSHNFLLIQIIRFIKHCSVYESAS